MKDIIPQAEKRIASILGSPTSRIIIADHKTSKLKHFKQDGEVKDVPL